MCLYVIYRTETATINVLLDDLVTLEKCSRLLNNQEQRVPNWKNLARECGISREEYESLEEDSLESPTRLIIDHISNDNPQLTVKKLFLAISMIDREDVLQNLKMYFKGEVAMYLEGNKGAGSGKISRTMLKHMHQPCKLVLSVTPTK